LRRAAETAELIYGHPVPREHQLSELRERNFGRLEGQPVEEWFVLNKEYERRFGSLPFAERMLRRAADFIESDGQVLSRVVKAFNQIAEQHQGQTVLVANHGGPIRVTLMHLGYADLLTAGSFQNGGYVVLIGDGHSLRIEKVVGVTKALNAE
jgi:broad specificity phosphatase PhoE